LHNILWILSDTKIPVLFARIGFAAQKTTTLPEEPSGKVVVICYFAD